MEVELKLSLSPQDNEQLLQHALIAEHARAPAHRMTLQARYFDTVDLHLLRHGAGLRVRQEDGVWLQTMKAGGGVQSGLHQRHEWEGPVDQPWPQLGRLRKLMGPDDGPWRDVLAAPHLKAQLEALFTVHVERHRWDLDVDGSHIELVLDHGHIERHGRRLPVNEIELELKSGTADSLYAFALRLQEQIPLHLNNVSKAERGYQLCRETGVIAHKAQPVPLAEDASVGQALLTVLDNCLQHIQKNEAAVIATEHIEALHQMRVGVRRLRSALHLFEDSVPCPEALQQDIAWLGEQLGAARDMEVLLSATLPRVAANPGGESGLMALQAVVLDAARVQRRQAAQALQSQRYTRLLLSLGLWMQQLETAAPQQGVADFAHHTLRQLHKRMLQRAGKISGDDPRAVHRLRIAGKRSRYAVDFFASLYRAKGTRAYLETLSAMQDELGWQNDLAVADQLLLALQQHPQHAAAIASAISFARGYLQALQSQEALDVGALRKTLHALHLPHSR